MSLILPGHLILDSLGQAVALLHVPSRHRVVPIGQGNIIGQDGPDVTQSPLAHLNEVEGGQVLRGAFTTGQSTLLSTH